MKILAISGSTRKDSLNSKLLSVVQSCAKPDLEIELYSSIGILPIFNPDLEGDRTPDKVLEFCEAIKSADGLLIASPEYVRAVPGGLKNAIDWLVSREEVIAKPIALVHASYRGDDMLTSLRIILDTVSERFTEDIFLRIPLQSSATITKSSISGNTENVKLIVSFLDQFEEYVSQS